MSSYRRRKRLRERVRARQAGRSEFAGEDSDPSRTSQWLRWTGVILQAVMLILVIVEVVRLIASDFSGISLVQLGIYTGTFFLGRLFQLVSHYV